jgi:cytochrome b561
MPLRNGEHGYGGVTKALHWLTFALIKHTVVQRDRHLSRML